jgi:hypothetical protein
MGRGVMIESSQGAALILQNPDGSARRLAIQRKRDRYALAIEPGGREILFCRHCMQATTDRESVHNFYCPTCNQFQDPDYPMGRVAMEESCPRAENCFCRTCSMLPE